MLAERPARHQVVALQQFLNGPLALRHGRNRRRALSAVTRATSKSVVPQTPANAAPTRATRAGSLGSPRWGGGERYGVSVSTMARSGGTTAAARRTASPVVKAIGPANEIITPSSRNRLGPRAPPPPHLLTT